MAINLKTMQLDRTSATARTKIIATLGPASNKSQIIEQLVLAGVDIFRLNFSYGDYRSYKRSINQIRKIAQAAKVQPTIIVDLQGLKLRVGTLPARRRLKAGSLIQFAAESSRPQAPVIPTQQDLGATLQPGQQLLINDGQIEALVKEVKDRLISCEVITGGVINSHNGIYLPDSILEGAAITAKDIADIRFGARQKVDYFALSFVQTADDIKKLRRYSKTFKSAAKIIAKIETRSGVSHLKEITAAADWLMVARGDLALAFTPEEVPILQRKITKEGQRQAKPVIIATQMLFSMTSSPKPTRAEVSDVATAVFTGADAVMLSEETAMGHFPIEAARTMRRITNYAKENASLFSG